MPFLESHVEKAHVQCRVCRHMGMVLKTCTAFEMPSSSDVHHCFMIGLRDNRWRGLVQEECEMEDIGDRHLAGHWVQHLR